jgi:zinc transport system ATP-binding protein
MSAHRHSTLDDNTGTTLCCEQLVVGYKGRGILPPIDLDVNRGRILLIVGRNGAGKSTLLKTMLRLLPPVSGKVTFASKSLRLAYVPQASSIDDIVPVSGRDVVAWGRLRGNAFLRPMSTRADRDAVDDALETADALAFAKRPFRDLSGGQKQRILFARMLASGADVALLDEPTASMDIAAERDAYRRLRALATERSMAIAIVTHTISAAAEHADRALYIDTGKQPGEGIVVTGAPETVFRHASFVSHFGEDALAP